MPPMVAEPASAAVSVASMRIVVVLPAPFGPTKPKISPAGTLKSTPRRAARPAYRLWRPWTSINAVSLVVQHQVGLTRLALTNAHADRPARGLAGAQRHTGGPGAGRRLAGQRLPGMGAPVEDVDASHRR